MRITQGIKRARNKLRDTLLSSAFDTLALSNRFRRIAFRKLFAQHLDPSVLAEVSNGGTRLCVDPKAGVIAFHLLSGRDWQREELDRAIAALRAAGALAPRKIFVDVGANIGTHTIYAMQTGLFSGGVSIEAEPANVNLIRRNVLANGLRDHVKVLHAAASCSKGIARLVLNRENFGAHSIQPGFVRSAGAAIDVPCDTVQGLLAEAGVSVAEVGLVWLDVEGHELEVLKGMGPLLEREVPVVLEFSLVLHGASGVKELKALLAPHYHSAVILRDKRRRGAGPSGVVSLQQLDLIGKQNDILVFNSVHRHHEERASGHGIL
jgi:FkbM family methyltransferase